VEDEVTHQVKTAKAKRIFGADGAYSAVRNAMMRLPRFDYSQTYLSHGYKELHLPPGPNGEHQIEKNCLHIWPRGSLMMIALPNMDGSFTVTCFFPFEGPSGFDFLDHAPDEDVANYFKKNFGDAYAIMPDLVNDFKRNPTASLVTVKCYPWSYKDNVVLLGEQLHFYH
jgi:kynurenine 3-monooxygenase